MPPRDDAYDYQLDNDPFPPAPDELASSRWGSLQSSETPELTDEAWAWHDARLIGVDRGAQAGEQRYEIGALDLCINIETGHIGGSYLPLTACAEVAGAVAFFHDVRQQMHDLGVASYQVPDFAEARAFEMNAEPENWRDAEAAEYEAYGYQRDLEAFNQVLIDEPSCEGPAPDKISEQGVEAVPAPQAHDRDADEREPVQQAPPFYDAESGTAYWIGVFQPSATEREHCVTSILSLRRDPKTGQMAAQLAPCVSGDLNKAQAAAEHLIHVAQKGDLQQVFDTAEGMALATDQRAFWVAERGVPLEADTVRDIAATLRDSWEVEL